MCVCACVRACVCACTFRAFVSSVLFVMSFGFVTDGCLYERLCELERFQLFRVTEIQPCCCYMTDDDDYNHCYLLLIISLSTSDNYLLNYCKKLWVSFVVNNQSSKCSPWFVDCILSCLTFCDHQSGHTCASSPCEVLHVMFFSIFEGHGCSQLSSFHLFFHADTGWRMACYVLNLSNYWNELFIWTQDHMVSCVAMWLIDLSPLSRSQEKLEPLCFWPMIYD